MIQGQCIERVRKTVPRGHAADRTAPVRHSRLGILGELTTAPSTVTLDGDYGTAKLSTFTRGEKLFELSNHLGNVLATITDKKLQHDDGSGGVDYYTADVATANDYYPFGMGMPGRKYAASNLYRYGFNGKENDNEVKGEGNQQDYGMRIYDPRLGKFLSIDTLAKDYPMLTPDQFASNRPIDGIDQDGLEWYYSNNLFDREWKMSTALRPPPIMATEVYKQEYYNKLGFLTLDQRMQSKTTINVDKI